MCRYHEQVVHNVQRQHGVDLYGAGLQTITQQVRYSYLQSTTDLHINIHTMQQLGLHACTSMYVRPSSIIIAHFRLLHGSKSHETVTIELRINPLTL